MIQGTYFKMAGNAQYFLLLFLTVACSGNQKSCESVKPEVPVATGMR